MAISALIIQTAEGTFGIVPAQITRYYVTRGDSTFVIETPGSSTRIKCPTTTIALAKHQSLLTGLTTGTGTLTLDDMPAPTTTQAPTTNPPG